jgi:tetratricopeptide (TPR) repeat protein
MIKKMRSSIATVKSLGFFARFKKEISSKGNNQTAEASLDKAFMLNPSNWEILYHKSGALFCSGEYGKAIPLLEECIKRATMIEGKKVSYPDASYVKLQCYLGILICGKKHNIGNFYTEMYEKRAKELMSVGAKASPSIQTKFPSFSEICKHTTIN